MSQTAIATAYDDAVNIVIRARQQNVNIIGVWSKLDRIATAISKSATAQLAETLQ